MTSHDVVATLRSASGEGRIGHAGTLDPNATGLLVVLVGPYTRLEPYLSAAEKCYEATIEFGEETDTGDADGAVIATAPVSDQLFEAERAAAIVEGFLGDREQVPPAYSAVKVGGLTSHKVARAGGELELPARPITVYEAEVLEIDPDARTWTVAFRVSKGTYIRSLAAEIGRAAGSVAHLEALHRTCSGPLTVFDAHALYVVREAAEDGRMTAFFVDPVAALALPTLEVAAEAVANGAALGAAPPDAADEQRFAVVADGRLAAVYRAKAGRLVAEAVFPAPQAHVPARGGTPAGPASPEHLG